jgi:hypothetical protein
MKFGFFRGRNRFRIASRIIKKAIVASLPPFPISVTTSYLTATKISFSSIPDYSNYIDINAPYSVTFPPWAYANKGIQDVSEVNIVYIINKTSIFLANSLLIPVGTSIPLSRNFNSQYATNLYSRTGPFYDGKGNQYYNDIVIGQLLFQWDSSINSWRLDGPTVANGSNQLLKLYSGGSSTTLPQPSTRQFISDNYEDDLHLDMWYYDTNYVSSLSAPNMLGENNNIYLRGADYSGIFKTITAPCLLTQTGKKGVMFNVTLPSRPINPISSAVFSQNTDYSSTYSNLSNIIGAVPLPKEASSSIGLLTVTTNCELSDLSSPQMLLSNTKTEFSNTDFNPRSYDLSSSIFENTSASIREISISGKRTYNGSAVSMNTGSYQSGTSTPTPAISVSENNSSPRNFFVNHIGRNIFSYYSRIGGEPSGIALWDSTKKLWAVAGMGPTGMKLYIRYFGGKYELIQYDTAIRQYNSSYNYLCYTPACAPTVMPWNAGDFANVTNSWGSSKVLDISFHNITNIPKPVVLRVSQAYATTFGLQTNYDLVTASRLLPNNNGWSKPYNQYRNLVFKGSSSIDWLSDPSLITMYYNYPLNIWKLKVGSFWTDKGNTYGNIFHYSAPYSTTFPLTFTFLQSEQPPLSGEVPLQTVTVSKISSESLNTVYSLSDVTYPATIPVDSAFSSIW